MTGLLSDITHHIASLNQAQQCRHGAVLLREAAAEIQRLRLSDAERVAVMWAIASLETDPAPDAGQDEEAAEILRAMLDRMQNST